MNLWDIVTAYLKEHGYDGLCNTEFECGCGLGGLAPCEEPADLCVAAHKKADGLFYPGKAEDEAPNEDTKT